MGDGDGDKLTDGLAEAVTNGLADGLAAGLAEGLGDGLGLGLGDADGVAEALVPGEDGGSAAEDEGDVHAETAAETSMAAMPQPKAVRVAPSPVRTVAHTPMGPPAHGRPRRWPRRTREGSRSRDGP